MSQLVTWDESTLSKVREKLWIPQIRVLTRFILGRCILCKRLNAKPMIQQMAPLPRSRVMAYKPPFSYLGMDLFGPLYVKHGRSMAKRWCCLFTCLNTRTIHLELVQSVGTDDFIKRELREGLEEWNQQQIDSELLQQGCKWIFQPPTTLSMSGVWKRLVRSAKTVLKAILGTEVVPEPVLNEWEGSYCQLRRS